MTLTAQRQAEPDHRVWRRWRTLAVAVTLVFLAGGLATVGTLRHLDGQYGPIQGGSFGGMYSDRGFVVSTDGFSYHLSAAPSASALMIASLDNPGAHSVKVTSIDTGDMVSNIRWSAYRFVAGGSNTGVETPWRAFPASVPAHGTIRLLITIHHPSNCSAYPKFQGVSDASYGGHHVVHWESLLHRHATLVDVLSLDQGIGVC